MAIPINRLKGLTEDLERNMHMLNVYNSEQLLAVCATPQQRKSTAELVASDPRTILGLANRADLTRIRGVAGVYSDLLEHAGVDTIAELAMRNPANLYAKLSEINESENLTKLLPTQKMVENWVAQAKELPRLIEY